MQLLRTSILGLVLASFFVACQNPNAQAWKTFLQCQDNCVSAALAVKDALTQDPKTILTQFKATYEAGDDRVIGWLYLLRDSVLLNPDFEDLVERQAIQKAVVDAAQPFARDPALNEMAKSVLDEIGSLRLEEEEVVEPALIPYTGTFAFTLPNDGGTGELKVSQRGVDRLAFELLVVGGKPAHNQGTITGEAKIISPGKAVYTSDANGGTCSLSFFYGSKGVEIQTVAGDPSTCGMGNGVSPDGVFARQGFEDSLLSPAAAQQAAKLVGKWQSLDDPKSTLTIDQGMYTPAYDGTDEASAIYWFAEKGFGDCGANSSGPTLVILAQDVACYAVVKADGKNLEISLLGGTGNTLRYQKIAK